MGLISAGIEGVRAFSLQGGIRSDGSFSATPRVAIVKWRSSWNDKFHQIYLNGQYAGTTIDTLQREMMVQTPSFANSAVKIEIFAVEPGEAYVDFSDELDDSTYKSGRVKIKLLRSQMLPMRSSFQIYSNNGKREIDYSRPINQHALKVWAAWQDKAGFGQSKFARSDFGYDFAAMPGLGKGNFGVGEFGGDSDIVEWVSGPLQAGIYKFGVRVTDERGNESIASESEEVIVIPASRPAKGISVSSFDREEQELILNIL